jgi:hypothetical protein
MIYHLFLDMRSDLVLELFIPMNKWVMFYIILNQDKKSINILSEELSHKWESIGRISKEFKEYLENNTECPVLSWKIE